MEGALWVVSASLEGPKNAGGRLEVTEGHLQTPVGAGFGDRLAGGILRASKIARP